MSGLASGAEIAGNPHGISTNYFNNKLQITTLPYTPFFLFFSGVSNAPEFILGSKIEDCSYLTQKFHDCHNNLNYITD